MPGTWLHAAGEYTEADGTECERVAVVHRPGARHGRPELVKEAAKEAVQGIGFDLLMVCGFAFDPHVSRGGKALRQADGAARAHESRSGDGRRAAQEDRRGQPVHGLRRAGCGNQAQPDGKSSVEIKGVDVYDPTTGEIRSQLDRRYRLLVHRHGLQRRELLRAPRLFHRRRTSRTRS